MENLGCEAGSTHAEQCEVGESLRTNAPYERLQAWQLRHAELRCVEPPEAVCDRLPDAVITAPEVGVPRPQCLCETVAIEL